MGNPERKKLDPRAHSARYIEARRQRRLGGAKLPTSVFEPNEVLVDFDEDMETGLVIMIGHADVYIHVTEKDEAGREVETVRKQPIQELAEGDFVNAELFTHDGVANGGISEVRVVARTQVTAVLVSPYDLADDKVHPIQRQERTDFVFDALARALEKHEQLRRCHRLDEEQFDAAIDAERGKRDEAVREMVQANQRAHRLERQNGELQLRIDGLEAENATLAEKNAELNRKYAELEASFQEAMSNSWTELTESEVEQGVSWLPPGPDPTKKPPDSG
ncbi:hypothetical protein M0Q28_03925 [Patescibacteria group bacterium]|jgi:hypothetical protein|nr:hypothetical protein [Patescibacteria group bacterium]